MTELEKTIDAAWDARASLSASTTGAVRDAVNAALAQLDSGALRVAEKSASGAWIVNQWLKKAVLLSFRLNPNRIMGAAGHQPRGGVIKARRQSLADRRRAQQPTGGLIGEGRLAHAFRSRQQPGVMHPAR